MRRRWPLWGAIAVLAMGVLAAYQSAVFSSRSGDAAPLYSTRRHDPYGTAALHVLLAERGVPTRTVERARLNPDDRGVLVQVLSGQGDAKASDDRGIQTRQLADWIAQGNTVIQLTRTPTGLMKHFGIDAAKEVGRNEIKAIQEAEARGEKPEDVPGSVYLAQLNGASEKKLTLRAPMTFAERPDDKAWTVLARAATYKDAIVAGEFRVGRGRLILFGAPTPALNYTIGDEGNLDFLLAATGKGPVLIDDWSHGIGNDATVIGFLLNAGLMPLLLQAAFVAGLFIWSTSVGRAAGEDELDEVSRGSGAEQMATLGYLYERSLGFDATFERVHAEVNRRLSECLRCRQQDVPAKIAALPPELGERCRGLLERLGQIAPPRGVACLTCGYDLRGNVTGSCPECGTMLTGELRRRVAEAGTNEPSVSRRRSLRPEATLVEVLNLSHNLSEEIRREQRVGK